jgi:ABC-type branched-subunit amino acid transport system ATPase component
MPADETSTATAAPRGGPGAAPDLSAARQALADVPHEPGAPKPDPILVADGIVRQFGGLTAVDVQHVEIQRGVIIGLIGPNGAGKTTFFNLLTGFDRPDAGTWSFNGKGLNRLQAYKVARLGMVRTFQLTKVLSKLTVIENMRVGATGQRGEGLLSAMFAPLWRAQETASASCWRWPAP